MLNKAFSGFGTDEELVSYAIGSSSKEHIEAIADLYEDIYGKSLVEDATSELGGLFEGDFQKAVSQYLNRDPLCQPPPSPGSALCDSSQLGRLREEVTEALEYIAMDDAKRTDASIIERRPALFFLGHISPIFAPFFLVFSRFSPS